MSGYLALARRTRVGDDDLDLAEAETEETALDEAFEEAVDAADQDVPEEASPDEAFEEAGPAYGPPEAGYAAPYAQEDPPPDPGSGGPPPAGGGAPTTVSPAGDPVGPPPTPLAPSPDPGTLQPSGDDAKIALLQQDVDDAEQAYYDAYQADLDALDEYYLAQAALDEGTGTAEDLRRIGDLIKPLAAALVPAADAVKRAKAALSAATGQAVTGAAPPSKKTPTKIPDAVRSAKALHAKTAPVHSQTAALHTLIKAAGPRPMTAATRAKARDLKQHRKQLAQARQTIKRALQAEVRKAPTKAIQKTTPPAKTAVKKTATLPKPRGAVPTGTKPRIHGDTMNGYTILGETVGEGFDLLSMFSGFLGGGKKESGPSAQSRMMQMQLQQQQAEAQRAREAAARAQTAAWAVGGVAGLGLFGVLLWKLIGR